MKSKRTASASAGRLALALSGCETKQTTVIPVPTRDAVPVPVPGPPGPPGPAGAPGPEGLKGEPGESGNTTVIIPPPFSEPEKKK
jgi:hypothetical protein